MGMVSVYPPHALSIAILSRGRPLPRPPQRPPRHHPGDHPLPPRHGRGWRRLFPSTLLDFKAGSIQRDKAVEAVTSILAAHPTEPVRSFSTCRLSFRREDDDAVDGWLRDLANRGIEELNLHFSEKRKQKVPESLFACASLKRLHVINGTFPDVTEAAAASLAVLTEIDLSDVKISEESLNSLLSHCTALERLNIRSISKFDRLHVRSRSLKVLSTSGDFKELFIDDAPSLVWVLGGYMDMRATKIKIAHAPKLEFLGYLGMNNENEFGDTKFTKFRKKNIHTETIMPSLKTLAVELRHTPEGYVNEHYINWFMQLLKVFPCLETIYIKSDSWSEARDGSPGSWDVLASVPCIDNHLEKVVFEVYRGQEWQRDMAKFLHGRSRFLRPWSSPAWTILQERIMAGLPVKNGSGSSRSSCASTAGPREMLVSSSSRVSSWSTIMISAMTSRTRGIIIETCITLNKESVMCIELAHLSYILYCGFLIATVL